MVTRAGRRRRSLRRPIANVTSVTPKARCSAKLSVTIKNLNAQFGSPKYDFSRSE